MTHHRRICQWELWPLWIGISIIIIISHCNKVLANAGWVITSQAGGHQLPWDPSERKQGPGKHLLWYSSTFPERYRSTCEEDSFEDHLGSMCGSTRLSACCWGLPINPSESKRKRRHKSSRSCQICSQSLVCSSRCCRYVIDTHLASWQRLTLLRFGRL